MNNQTTIKRDKEENKYSIAERILIFNLFGYFLESIMLDDILAIAFDDIPKFWCFTLPFPETLFPILIVNILIGIIISIWFFKSANKEITFISTNKFLLISPFLQLAILVIIVFLIGKYV